MTSNKVYVVGVGMSKFIKPRGEVDYPGTHKIKELIRADIIQLT